MSWSDTVIRFNSLYHSTALPLPTVFPPPTGRSGDWRLVGSLDMLDYKNQRCPSTWKPYLTKKACGRISSPGCSSVIVSTGSGAFRQICGRVRAFQWGTTDGFAAYATPKPVTIDGPYVDGISITYYDEGKRQHVFTYAAGLMEQYNPAYYPAATCPCAGGAQPPLFVRSTDYYCESGNPDSSYYVNQIFCDPLWDGKECRYDEESCCTPPNQPWFCKDLFKRVASDLEIRICSDEAFDNEDIAVESYELYVR